MTGPKYYNGRAILRSNAEMNCNDIFMRLIFCSTWNAKVIAQSQQPTEINGGLSGADAEEKIVFHGH